MSPLSGPFFRKWESWGKRLIKNGKILSLKGKSINSMSYRSHNDRNNFFSWYLKKLKKNMAGQETIAKFQDFHRPNSAKILSF